MLQILVTHYNEPKEIVKRFLDSLGTQIDTEFSVLFCSDGGDVKMELDDFSSYPFKITYTYATHSGLCHTRNILLDKSTSKYIMFCDVDDEFTAPGGLKALLDKAEETGADIVGSPYIEEASDPKKNVILNEDTLRIHGKIFRREYLVKNVIRFPDNEKLCDLGFIWLALALTNKICWIDKCFYTWKYNKDSITRKDRFFRYSTYARTLSTHIALLEELKLRGRRDLYDKLLASLFGMVYVNLTHPMVIVVPTDIIEYAKSCAKELVFKYLNDYKAIRESLRYKCYKVEIDYERADCLAGSFVDMIPWFERLLSDNIHIISGYKKSQG